MVPTWTRNPARVKARPFDSVTLRHASLCRFLLDAATRTRQASPVMTIFANPTARTDERIVAGTPCVAKHGQPTRRLPR